MRKFLNSYRECRVLNVWSEKFFKLLLLLLEERKRRRRTSDINKIAILKLDYGV